MRQPLKMDKLPTELLDRVMQERAAGRTWSEIEELSPRFDEWEKTKPEIRAQYPGLRIPHSTLQRWYDLRVEQVKKELLQDQARAREIARMFAVNKFEDLPDAVRNALGDTIFALMQSPDEKSKSSNVKKLLDLGWLLAQQEKLKLQERKTKVDERALQFKIQQMKDKVVSIKKGIQGAVNKKKELDPAELQQKLDEIYGLASA